MIRIWVSIFAILASTLIQPVFASDRVSARCIGDICLSQPKKDTNWLLNKYGKGKVRRDTDDPETLIYCFYNKQQNLWVEFEFSPFGHEKKTVLLTGIFITSVKMCSKSFVSSKPLPNFASEYGVKIGMTEAAILKKMGAPKRKDNVKAIEKKSSYLAGDLRYASKFGRNRIVYDDNPSSLLFNFYGLEKGKLVSMWFAERE